MIKGGETQGKEINIVSYGGGQNSTAMIIEMYNRKLPITEIIYSEVGNEMPETYIFMGEFKKWCTQKKIKFVEVRSKLGTIREYYESKNIIPYRMFRHCTHKFKIIPINKYIRDTYGLKTPVNMIMGIANDETHSADKIQGRKQFTYKFPLIEWKIDRQGCIDIIQEEGLSIPVKSGCYFCPFQPKRAWKDLFKKHPKLYNDSISFEKNCKAYPKGNLMGNQTLESFKKIIKEQKNLDQFDDMKDITKCAYCHT